MAGPATPDLAGVVKLVGRLAEAIARADATAADVARVAGGDVSDDGAPLAVRAPADVPGVEQVSVTRQWGGDVPNAATLVLAPGLNLTQLEAALGAARPIPGVRPASSSSCSAPTAAMPPPWRPSTRAVMSAPSPSGGRARESRSAPGG